MNFNMLCSPTLTSEQIRLCDTYLIAIPPDIEQLHSVSFMNRVCKIFDVTSDELAFALSNFRLFCNDITCIHCGVRYEIKEPLAFHKLPNDWQNWTCKSCGDFLQQSFDFSLLLDWYPADNATPKDDDDDCLLW